MPRQLSVVIKDKKLLCKWRFRQDGSFVERKDTPISDGEPIF